MSIVAMHTLELDNLVEILRVHLRSKLILDALQLDKRPLLLLSRVAGGSS